MNGICHIVGAADFAARRLDRAKNDIVIAADAGLSSLEAAGIEPDMILGDFDSLGYTPKGETVISHPVHKDETDSMLAMREGIARGYSDFIFHGCTGGRRFDHTLASIQSLAYAAEQGLRASIYAPDFTLEAIHDSALRFACGASGDISVFAHGNEANGVWLSGLEYPLYNARLDCLNPLGVSNSFLGGPATVRVNRGTLIVVWTNTRLCRPELID